MSRGDRESELGRLLLGGMVGALLGATVGLVLFGGILMLPVVFMVAGTWIGVSQAAKDFPLLPAKAPRPRMAARGAGRGSSAPLASGPVRLPSRAFASLARIDVNSAGIEELSLLPGVGKGAAARIVEHRERFGPFAALGDLQGVEGFDHGRVARLAPRAIVSAPGPASEHALPA